MGAGDELSSVTGDDTRGPKTEPYGTPRVSERGWDEVSDALTEKARMERLDYIQMQAMSEKLNRVENLE